MLRSIGAARRALLGLVAADERAAADVAGGQPAARRLGVGAGDRGHRDAEVVGQVAMRRQPGAGAQRALLHVLVDGVGNGPIDRAAAALQVRQPHCHGQQYTDCPGAMQRHVCNAIVRSDAVGARQRTVLSRRNGGPSHEPHRSYPCDILTSAMGKRIFLFLADQPRDRRDALDRPQPARRRNQVRGRRPRHRSLAVFCLSGAWAARSSRCRCRAGLPSGRPASSWSTAGPGSAELDWLYSTVERLTRQANLPMPEVGVYDSPEVNAFATGPSKSRSLVAVSSGLLRAMRQEEIEGVLAHEVAHIANGDMVTMTLLQGVINAFVMFLARLIAFAMRVAATTRRRRRRHQLPGRDRARDRARHPRLADHRVVLAAARVPGRPRRRHAGRPRADARRAAPAGGQPRARRHPARRRSRR